MICYSLRRLMSIFGVNELKKRLKGLVLHFLLIYQPFLNLLKFFYKNRLSNIYGSNYNKAA